MMKHFNVFQVSVLREAKTQDVVNLKEFIADQKTKVRPVKISGEKEP